MIDLFGSKENLIKEYEFFIKSIGYIDDGN